jgi:hypothetical protein
LFIIYHIFNYFAGMKAGEAMLLEDDRDKIPKRMFFLTDMNPSEQYVERRGEGEGRRKGEGGGELRRKERERERERERI